jgi:hypothetical protein
MEKIIVPSSWDFGESITQLVKYSSKGLIGYDYSVLVKRAGEETAHWIKNIKVASDQVPVHVIAMGATEAYGPNRNGDGFKEAALKQYHDTFVKYAQHFRHHKNKDPKIRYGQVKASFYNEGMRRVELLSLLNATKEAAEKYGGYEADKELQLINRGEDIPVSMACKIAYDVCSGCGNKAKTRAEYCTEDNCKYGGCRDNLTKVASDGHLLHVDNPHPTFFDISTVIRPADRIAYGNVAEYLQKAASCVSIGGAALAEAYGVTSPFSVVTASEKDPAMLERLKVAYELATLEDKIESNHSQYVNLARAFTLKGPEVDLSPLGNVGTEKFATGFNALADQHVLLPVKEFLRLTIGDSEKLAELSEIVPSLLPGIYNRLIADSVMFESKLSSMPDYFPSQKLASATQRNWAQKLAEHYSITPDNIRRRMALSSIRDIGIPNLKTSTIYKTAAHSKLAEELARVYAMYKLAYLIHKNDNLPFTRELVVLQNYVQ